MPALPNVPKAFKIVVHQLLDATSPIINSYHYGYQTGSAITNGQAAGIAADAVTSWVTNILAHQLQSLVLESIDVIGLASPTDGAGAALSGATGTSIAAPVAAGTAMVIKQIIARKYRGGHSRTYLGGFDSTQLHKPDEWLSSTVNNVTAGLAAFATDIATSAASHGLGTTAPCNVSYYHGFTPFTYPSGRVRNIPTLRPVPIVDFLTAYLGDSKPGSQRRRNIQSS